MKVINYLIFIFLKIAGFISSKKNINTRNKFGCRIGDLLRLLSKKRQKIAIDNLKHAFPEKSDRWINDVMINSYRNLGVTLSELVAFKYFNENTFKKYIQYENIELINDLYAKGNGLILLSGHFGNWEMLAYTAGLFSNADVTVIVKHQKNQYADKVLNKYRTLGGNKIISMNNAARTIISNIRKGKAIALLADQNASKDKDIFVDFFGRPVITYEAPAAIALKFNVPVVMGFAVRKPDNTYYVKLIQLKTDDLDNSKESIKTLTQRHVKILEDAIRENPELWVWQHKRWKHKLPSN